VRVYIHRRTKEEMQWIDFQLDIVCGCIYEDTHIRMCVYIHRHTMEEMQKIDYSRLIDIVIKKKTFSLRLHSNLTHNLRGADNH